MLAFPILLLAPVAVLILGLYFLIRGPRTGLLPAVIGAAIVAALQLWAIRQSRSSTAAIGILFVPGYAAIAMASIWGARRMLYSLKAKHEQKPWRLWATGLLYLPAIAIAIMAVKGGLDERDRNHQRDDEQRIWTEKYTAAKQDIRSELAKNPGHEAEALEQMIESHLSDESFLFAALDFEEVTASRLKKLAESKRFEISILRHPKVTPALIEEIYRRTEYKEGLFTTLASNPNTPLPILREIDAGRSKFVDLDNLTASNPAAPHDILLRISKSENGSTLLRLIDNPSIDCEVASSIEESAPKARGEHGKEILEKAAKAIFRLCGP